MLTTKVLGRAESCKGTAVRSAPRRVWNRLSFLFSKAIQGFADDRCLQLAAAIAYRFIFSIFPLAIFLVSILGVFLRDSTRRENLVDAILDVIPLSGEGPNQLERVLANVPTPWSVVGLVSIAVTLWSASGLMGALRVGLNVVWDVHRDRPWVRSKLVDFVLVLGAGIFILASVLLTGLVQIVDRLLADAQTTLGALGGLAEAGSFVFGILVPTVLSFVTFAILYRFVPAASPRFRDVWFGALFAAVGFELLKNGFAFYVRSFGNYDAIYGSLGTIVAFLYLIYLSSNVFLFGAELSALWKGSAATRRPVEPPDPTPIGARALGALKNLVVLEREPDPLARARRDSDTAASQAALTVAGPFVFESVETPFGTSERMLGGPAVHVTLAAAFFTEVHVLSVVGDDVGDQQLEVLRTAGVETNDIERAHEGRTASWSGRYGFDLDVAETLASDPGVPGSSGPVASAAAAKAPLLFLGPMHPDLQREARATSSSPRFVGLSSASSWIASARDSLIEAIRDVDLVILNDAEVRMLTGESSPVEAAARIREWGPRAVVITEGSHGAALFTEFGITVVAGYAPGDVVDPTGASGSFAGGFLGYLAARDGDVTEDTLRRATVYGSVLASFAVEGFGSERITRLMPTEIDKRFEVVRRTVRVEPFRSTTG